MIEREFYRLTELAERWACTVHDLLHLGIQDRAQVCVNIYGMAKGLSKVSMETEAPDAAPDDEPLTKKEQQEAEAHGAAFERWKNRTTKDMPHGVFELGHNELRFLDMPDAFPYELGEALKFDGGWWECEFDPPLAISIDHLCMLHEEVMRLQREMFNSFSAMPLAREAVSGLSRLKDVTLWPKHTTKKLTALRLAAFKFWGENYDPSEPDTAPKNEAVIAWLQKEHGIGATPAAEMASILRPETLRPGPR